jgi:L-lactate dehydrogenase
MKVGVVGCGLVGATAAYAMILQGMASEILLIDLNQEMARAQAEDLLHATPFAGAVRIARGIIRTSREPTSSCSLAA